VATNAENLVAIKASLIAALAAEAAYQEGYGPQFSYSLDGESYQKTEWREAVLRKIKELNILIQQEDPVWVVRSRARS
jgi:hypothetical protein